MHTQHGGLVPRRAPCREGECTEQPDPFLFHRLPRKPGCVWLSFVACVTPHPRGRGQCAAFLLPCGSLPHSQCSTGTRSHFVQGGVWPGDSPPALLSPEDCTLRREEPSAWTDTPGAASASLCTGGRPWVVGMWETFLPSRPAFLRAGELALEERESESCDSHLNAVLERAVDPLHLKSFRMVSGVSYLCSQGHLEGQITPTPRSIRIKLCVFPLSMLTHAQGGAVSCLTNHIDNIDKGDVVTMFSLMFFLPRLPHPATCLPPGRKAQGSSLFSLKRAGTAGAEPASLTAHVYPRPRCNLPNRM